MGFRIHLLWQVILCGICPIQSLIVSSPCHNLLITHAIAMWENNYLPRCMKRTVIGKNNLFFKYIVKVENFQDKHQQQIL